MADNAKELKKTKEKASEFAGEAKEFANDFASGAKKVIDSKESLTGILSILLGQLSVHKFIPG